MYVIGTAGHVDHGKTLLIKALTGIDTDRLPEEQERGMTIDLGFAHFPDQNGTPIGVIDVPGHERFIKNMAAGAWSINCALMVVAADDGWMRQSQDHLHVLHYLEIKSIILVISKSDIAAPERIIEVEKVSLNKIKNITGLSSKSIAVSAVTDSNIEELKQMIITELNTIRLNENITPVLYVDRVFNLQGSGTIVTGSLKGGMIKDNSQLLCLPENNPVRIRSIQSYNSVINAALPVSRVAINIRNLKKTEIRRGSCITSANSSVKAVSEFFFSLKNRKTKIRNHSEVEIAIGTAHQSGEIHFLKDGQIGRIILKKPIAAAWRQPFVLIRHGGSEILGGGNILWIGKTEKEIRKKLIDIISGISDSRESISESDILFKLYGYIKINRDDKEPLLSKTDSITIEDWVFDKEKHIEYCLLISRLALNPGGVSIAELPGKLKIPVAAIKVIYHLMIAEKKINLNDMILTAPDETGIAISPFGKNLLNQLKEGGKSGLELNRLKFSGAPKELRNLCRTGHAVNLDGNIFYHPDTYRECVSALVCNKTAGSRFTIPEAKEEISLSRKFIIPLLNKMESDGYVKRDENERIILKSSF